MNIKDPVGINFFAQSTLKQLGRPWQIFGRTLADLGRPRQTLAFNWHPIRSSGIQTGIQSVQVVGCKLEKIFEKNFEKIFLKKTWKKSLTKIF